MKALGVAKRCWLILMLGGLLSVSYYMLSTSNYVKIGRQKLRQMTARIFPRPPHHCRYSPTRSEKEVARCFHGLAQTVLKLSAQRLRRPPFGWPGMPPRGKRGRQEMLARLWAEKMLKGGEKQAGPGLPQKSLRGFLGGSGGEVLLQTVTPPVEELLEKEAFQFQARGDPFRIPETNQDGFVRSRDIKTSTAMETDPGDARFPLRPVPVHHLNTLRRNNTFPTARLRRLSSKQRHAKNRPISPRTFNLSESALRKMETRFKERRRVLEKGCERYRNSSMFKPLARHLFLLPDPTQASGPAAQYCPIPKTGSTTWLKVLAAVGRERLRNHRKTANAAAPFSVREFKLGQLDPGMLDDLSAAQGEELVKLVFVREPYSRLLSAYVDKLFSPNSIFWAQIGRYIVRTFRHNPSSKSLTCGHDVTFPEFLAYVLHAQDTGRGRESHFAPLHDHCGFCNLTYSHVGHLDTLAEDMDYVLHALGSGLNYSGPFEEDTLRNNAQWVFSRMRKDVLKCMTLEEAGRRLWRKWQIRGLVHKAEPFPFPGIHGDPIHSQSVVAAGLAAVRRSGGLWAGKGQKTEALSQAFASVPLQDRLRLRKMLFLDFELFGFDPDLPAVFSSQNDSATESGFKYFDV